VLGGAARSDARSSPVVTALLFAGRADALTSKSASCAPPTAHRVKSWRSIAALRGGARFLGGDRDAAAGSFGVIGSLAPS
jgi:hypothetical protein